MKNHHKRYTKYTEKENRYGKQKRENISFFKEFREILVYEDFDKVKF